MTRTCHGAATVLVIVDMKPTIPQSVRGDADTCKYTTVRLQHYPEVKRGGGGEETRSLSGCALSKHRHPTLYTLVWYIYIILFHVDLSVWMYSMCSQRKYARLHDFMLYEVQDTVWRNQANQPSDEVLKRKWTNIQEEEFGQKLKDSSQVSPCTWTVKMYFKTMDQLLSLSWVPTSLVTPEKKNKMSHNQPLDA